ncbi:hypothetical protein FACS1894159_00120 [Bacteroidia bacterium]|nr:hypothetical protein FACS1894159_00120 [Bacteroidia bacterium]
MYIVNTTFVVEPHCRQQWISLMENEYMPLLRQSGMGAATLCRIISERAEEHLTYALMVEVESMADYSRLTGELFDRYLELAGLLFGQRPLSVTTLLKKELEQS